MKQKFKVPYIRQEEDDMNAMELDQARFVDV